MKVLRSSWVQHQHRDLGLSGEQTACAQEASQTASQQRCCWSLQGQIKIPSTVSSRWRLKCMCLDGATVRIMCFQKFSPKPDYVLRSRLPQKSVGFHCTGNKKKSEIICFCVSFALSFADCRAESTKALEITLAESHEH